MEVNQYEFRVSYHNGPRRGRRYADQRPFPGSYPGGVLFLHSPSPAEAGQGGHQDADDVITIGGIVGTIVSTKEDTLVIETGSDRSKIRVTRWAIQQNTTPKEK